jgi:hypothetical protein
MFMDLKKRALILVIFISIYLSYGVYAVIGISPGAYEIDFKPNLKQTFRFTIIGDNDMKFKLSAEGELAKYVTLSPKSLDGPGNVQVLLSLPDNVELPGENIVYISAKQQPSGRGGIYLLGNVKGIIKIRVPYPEEFASASISANNANVGEPVNLKISVKNLGKSDISAKIVVNIIDSQNRSVTSLPLGTREIASLGSTDLETQLNTEGYLPGYYVARAIVSYGNNKEAKTETIFRLGEFFVDITGHSDNFNKNMLNRFNLQIESFWSGPIEKVYANVSIMNYSQINFVTSSLDLGGFESSNLTGYFDTTGILENKFNARVVLHYGNKTNEKILNLKFKEEKKSKLVYYLAGVLVGLIILLIFIWIIARRMKKSGHKKR